MSRVITALVLVPLALLAVFRLSGWGFLLFALVLVEIAAVEYSRLTSRLAGRVAWLVPVLIPMGVVLLLPGLGEDWLSATDRLLALGFLLSVVVSIAALFARVSLDETVAAIGLLSFGVVYFAVPVTALVRLHALDPWLVVLAAIIVWAGDTAAYYVGSAFGKHKLAPSVSPKKTWEGAAASFVAAVLVAAIWSSWRLGDVRLPLLLIAAGTSVVAQLGDLVESTFKRRVGVKDSGSLLPGHGGMFDRLDSLLFALPALAIGLLLAGWDLP